MSGRTEDIEIEAQSIEYGRAVVVLPSRNPAIGPTLHVIVFKGQGYLLRITDPINTIVWEILLTGKEPIDPHFSVAYREYSET